ADGARSLVDGKVRVGIAGGIGIGDRNTAYRLPGGFEGALVVVSVKKRICHIAVTMGPAVDGDGSEIAGGGEPSRSEHAVEVVADRVLEIRKGHAEELGGADPKLGARIEP